MATNPKRRDQSAPTSLGGIRVDVLFPPLRFPAEVLAVAVAMLPPARYEIRGKWAEMPVEQIDPQAPRRNLKTALVQPAGRDAFIFIYPLGAPSYGQKAMMVRIPYLGPSTEHTLVNSETGRLIRWNGRNDAMRVCEPIVDSRYFPPRGWSWDPPIHIPPDDDGWTPTRPEGWEGWEGWDSCAFWCGKSARWDVLKLPYQVFAKCDGRWVEKAPGIRHCFPDVAAAKKFCVEADGQ